jgi:hypothetical protein
MSQMASATTAAVTATGTPQEAMASSHLMPNAPSARRRLPQPLDY